MTTQELLRSAQKAKEAMALADAMKKNAALLAMADALTAHTAAILKANQADLESAQGHIGEVMLDRLRLT